ncbi:hypothetical protein BDN72DRAFT_850025 [Pluteus cervinus]|uniref:Uncharacterized protein n=1 Tax=Pluteus cervinus TaxID=181527 RepID=A0ACD3A5V0_9AGAR|nr:hypothetical protein BDN72DRAFT_850025 [Pluteus cervinus]
MEDPRLPPELESQIFLMALQLNFSDIRNLLLIAKRVHAWLLPKAFEVAVLGIGRSFPITFTLEKFKRYGHYIRYLFLTAFATQRETGRIMALDYLSLCPNVINLSIRIPSLDPAALQSALINLPLIRLSIHVDAILFVPPSPQLSELFSNLTHLHLYNTFDPARFADAQPPILRPLFPNLTHIAFLYPHTRENLRLAIEGWDSLRVVLLWYLNAYLEGPIDAAVQPLHPRLVILGSTVMQPWEDGARGRGQDIWEISERIVQSRIERK